jgi:hypothetical protein
MYEKTPRFNKIVTVQCAFQWQCMVFQKEFYNGIPYATVWRVLRKNLYLKVYKLLFVQGIEGVNVTQ